MYVCISHYFLRIAFFQSASQALKIIYWSLLKKNDPFPRSPRFACCFVRVWDTPWWRLQNMAKIHHTCPEKAIQRFWVHNLWNLVYAEKLSIISVYFQSLSLSLTHTHTHTHKEQSYRKFKRNNQMKKSRKLRPKVFFNLKPGPGCQPPSHPSPAAYKSEDGSLWLEMS